MSRTTSLACAVVVCAAVVGAVGGGARGARADEADGRMTLFENSTGLMGTLNAGGAIDVDNPFFQDLGTNGRRCVSCHQPDSAWSITPQNVQHRLLASHGTDSIFSNNDGSNCEGAAAATVSAKRAAYSLLLTRGLIRVGLDVPANA